MSAAGAVRAAACPSWCQVDHESQRAAVLADTARAIVNRGRPLRPDDVKRAYDSADAWHQSHPDARASVSVDGHGAPVGIWCMELPSEVDFVDLATARTELAELESLVHDLRTAISTLEDSCDEIEAGR